MRHFQNCWHKPLVCWGVWAIVALSCNGPALAQSAAPDPVEELRKALKTEVDTSNPADLQDRRNRLRARAALLRSIGDLRRALLLPEWRGKEVETEIDVDRDVRQEIGARLQNGLSDALHSQDASVRLAAVTTLGEMGVSLRGPGIPNTFVAGLAPELIRLIKEDNTPLREAAARALSHVPADPETAAPALGGMLPEGDAAQQHHGAEGLADMVREITRLVRESRSSGIQAIPVERAEAVKVGRAVLAAVGPGLSDADPQVRHLSLEAVQLAAGLFTLPELLPGPFRSGELKARPRAPEDVEALEEARQPGGPRASRVPPPGPGPAR